MKRVDEIFAEAIELAPEERDAFLDVACAGDSGLRKEVVSLLHGYDEADDFLEQSVVARPLLSAEEKPGDAIGPYTLIHKLGDGGCGIVYLARQDAPVRRQVALKVIKLGMDTRQVITRFEGERQALAIMDHPDIARVFDAGATSSGRPYFVMEYVDGIPVTEFCDRHRLSLPERLRLFVRVCLAVQHAHQKGIIHRDLKPSNILVAWRDQEPAPKVIDFGIAKATRERLTERTLVTRVDHFLGTPAYMSPEQADLRDGDIDTRSDIYSLGVLLYELLSGGQPYNAQTIAHGGVEEIRRQIGSVVPPRPSHRLVRMSDLERSAASAHRRLGPAQLSTTLKGDLDWIVMRCLEKERGRRYSSAQELSDDIGRYLRDEPVRARPPGTVYLARKFVARHRIACASAAMIAITLVTATGVSMHQAIRAREAERLAQAERDAARAASNAEALARADAQRRQEQAEDLVAFMLGDFRAELEKFGRLGLLDAVGEKVMDYFSTLDPRDLTDTALAQQARALTQIGSIRMDEGRYPEAEAAFSAAFQRAAALTERHPSNADMLFERAQAEFWLGYIARGRGQVERAHQWMVRYRDSALELAALEGNRRRARLELVYGHHNLAVLDVERGRLDDARQELMAERAVLEAMLAAEPRDRLLLSHLADNDSWLGTIAERDGRLEDALAHFDDSARAYEQLATEEPETARWRLRTADNLTFHGEVLGLLGRGAEALEACGSAAALLNDLVRQDPLNLAWRRSATVVNLAIAELHIQTGDLDGARQISGNAVLELSRLVNEEPASVPFTSALATAWRIEALLRNRLDREDAEAAITQSLSIGARLLAEERADYIALGDYVRASVLGGLIAARQGNDQAAQARWQLVPEVLEDQLPSTRDWRFLEPASQAFILLGRPEDAEPLVRRLRASGYQPLDPLTAEILEPDRKSTDLAQHPSILTE